MQRTITLYQLATHKSNANAAKAFAEYDAAWATFYVASDADRPAAFAAVREAYRAVFGASLPSAKP